MFNFGVFIELKGFGYEILYSYLILVNVGFIVF